MNGYAPFYLSRIPKFLILKPIDLNISVKELQKKLTGVLRNPLRFHLGYHIVND